MATAFRHGVHYSYAEYLELEAASNVKHEYLGGQIYAMAGGTPEHAALQAAVIGFRSATGGIGLRGGVAARGARVVEALRACRRPNPPRHLRELLARIFEILATIARIRWMLTAPFGGELAQRHSTTARVG